MMFHSFAEMLYVASNRLSGISNTYSRKCVVDHEGELEKPYFLEIKSIITTGGLLPDVCQTAVVSTKVFFWRLRKFNGMIIFMLL